MVSDEELAYLREYNRHAQPFPLDADSPEYVAVYELPGVEDPIEILKNQILLAPNATSAHLFSGHIGSGKSTELKRLAQRLRDVDYIALYVDLVDGVDEEGRSKPYLDRTRPVHIAEFLLAVAAALTDAAAAGNWATGTVSRAAFTDWAKGKLAAFKVVIPVVQASIDFGQLLGGDEGFRSQFREKLSGSEEPFVRDVLDYIADLGRQLTSQNGTKQGIVAILDSIEKVRDPDVPGPEGRPVLQSVRELFTRHAARLHLPGFSTVYAVSPYLPAYEHAALGQLFAGNIATLACVRIRQRDGSPDQDGVAALVDAVMRRAPNGDWNRLFADESCVRELVELSGGHLRNLMLGLREFLSRTLSRSALPGGAAEVEATRKALDRGLRPIMGPDAIWLGRVAVSGQPVLDDDADLVRFGRALDSGLLLAYRNGEDWYCPHPLVLTEVLKAAADVG